MKSYIIIVIVSLYCLTTFGQIKTYDIPIENGDTSLWFKKKQKEMKKMELSNLTISSDTLHFRFWTIIQVVDIWTKDFKTFNGVFLNHTVNTTNNKKNPDKIYFNKTPIDTATARIIYNLFADNLIFQIPSDKKIKGWEKREDGEEFLIEYSTNTFYAFKEYWSPSVYKEIKDAVIIDKLVKKMNSILNFDKNWNKFIHSLPKGCYRTGEITQICI